MHFTLFPQELELLGKDYACFLQCVYYNTLLIRWSWILVKIPYTPKYNNHSHTMYFFLISGVPVSPSSETESITH